MHLRICEWGGSETPLQASVVCKCKGWNCLFALREKPGCEQSQHMESRAKEKTAEKQNWSADQTTTRMYTNLSNFQLHEAINDQI